MWSVLNKSHGIFIDFEQLTVLILFLCINNEFSNLAIISIEFSRTRKLSRFPNNEYIYLLQQ